MMPARGAKDLSMVVDLDDLIAKPVGFRFRGRLYRVEPVSAERFMRVSGALAEAAALLEQAKTESVSQDQIYEAYHQFIGALVPDFQVDVLKDMTLPQVHGMINLLIKQVTGQPMMPGGLEKKKMSLGA
jgi:hypothetical protein